MGKLADAWVEVSARDQKMVQDLDATKGKLTAFVANAKTNMAIPLAIAGGGAAVTAFLAGAIAKASDLNETLSKVNTVFGDSAGGVIGQAEELSERFGLVRNEALAAASNIGLIAKASGLSQSAAAELSARFTRLAADAGSFYNVPLADALEKIRAGLVGESEPIRSFGVLLSEAAVTSEALALGLVKSKNEMTEASKVQARASLIIKGMTDATGDLERTSSSASNQMKKLWGQLEELQTDVGAKLLPALTDLLPVATDLGENLAEALDADGTKALVAGLGEVAKMLGEINGMSKEAGERGFLGNLMRFGPVLGAPGMARAVVAGDADREMEANAKPFPFMAAHEAERAKQAAKNAADAAGKWIVDWGDAIAKDADDETRRLMALPVNNAAAEAARARGFKVEHADAVAFNRDQGARELGGDVAGLGRALLGGLIANAAGQARGGLALAGRFVEGVGQAVDREPREANWTDMVSASRQLQLDALRGDNPADLQRKANETLVQIKGGIEDLAEAVRAGAGRAVGAVVYGRER